MILNHWGNFLGKFFLALIRLYGVVVGEEGGGFKIEEEKAAQSSSH